MDEQKLCAAEASKRFLDRYEYMSLWETQEVHDELNEMWEAAQDSSINEMDVSGGEMGATLDLSSPDAMCRRSDPEESPDPDEGKPRATVRQYSALIAQKVMTNLEGLAQARVEKRPRPYQTDAEIHQSYIKATSGGGGEMPTNAQCNRRLLGQLRQNFTANCSIKH